MRASDMNTPASICGVDGGRYRRQIASFMGEVSMYAKCPKCEKNMTNIKAVAQDIYVAGSPKFKGVWYCCNWCSTAISACVDQIALKADIINAFKNPR